MHDRVEGERVVRFDGGERFLHWVVAALVLVLATTGAILSSKPSLCSSTVPK